MNKETFGDRLLQLLKHKRWSQRKVSEALGISRTAVNKWTKGGMIDDANLERLAAFLDVDKIWLKYGEYYGSAEKDENQQLLARHINDFYLHESNQIVTWDWDILTDEVRYSDNVEQVYGMAIHSNDDFLSLMTEKSRDRLLAGYTKIIQNGGAHELDFKIHQNGESRWIKSRAAGVKGPNGKITKIVGISLDYTKQKKEEIALRQQHCFFEFFLQQQTELVVFMDQKGGIMASNCAVHQLDFLKLQAFLYQWAMDAAQALADIVSMGQGTLEYQGKSLQLSVGCDDSGRHFLMLKSLPDAWRES
ncbi:helix-turn-helix domain-containing protein [Wohlfahrtiimonas chitiniclastica]|uniref:helix-turn-helix domain-containing protein n=1 Tax=Wohlfahrtiimonas chitiniclastica TaxID=400946 RepID=UPI0007B69785|nr:helix-turn-helix domain-containing protein [Wohlfahrtiimonas chitiniclastica]KZX38114.1 transcriptional regulator [Wohlfahrtiimonas chitiniclastica]